MTNQVVRNALGPQPILIKPAPEQDETQTPVVEGARLAAPRRALRPTVSKAGTTIPRPQ